MPRSSSSASRPHTSNIIKRSTVDRAKARLLEWLGEGRVAVGELVPSERKLSEILDLDRGTLRRAMKLAADDRYLVREGRRLLRGNPLQDLDRASWMSQAVAVAVPSLDLATPQMRPWIKYVTLGATEAVRAAGYHAVTLNTNSLRDHELGPIIQSRPMGVLLPEVLSAVESVRRVGDAFMGAGIPVVVYGDDPSDRRFDRVASDHEQGSYLLTAALIEQGRRPACVWRRPWDTWWLTPRRRGYERAMVEAGLEPWPIVEFPDLPSGLCDREEFERACRQLVGFLMDARRRLPGADALMVVSDRDVFYAAEAARMLGIEPQRELALAGYDNYWAICEERSFTPIRPWFTVDKHNERMGREMLDLLLERIGGLCSVEPALRRITPELVRVM